MSQEEPGVFDKGTPLIVNKNKFTSEELLTRIRNFFHSGKWRFARYLLPPLFLVLAIWLGERYTKIKLLLGSYGYTSNSPLVQ
jgi:hypothetical protein